LVVASWNVENLGGTDADRIRDTAGIISTHLKCPDVLSMPEVQDNNADNIFGGSAADQTLANLIKALKCPGSDYRPINIDPIPFRDGGEFGGNIRVAMIYNAARVSFTPKGHPTASSDTFVESNGSLNQNPGRIDPRNPALEGSRKPLVAEFFFKGQRVFVIGNHFNSMLGEGSPLGAMQPYRFRTEKSRTAIAGVVRNFIEELRSRDANAHLVVAGDFNSYHQSNSMQTLAGDFLINMMTADGLFPRNRWFTTNYDGNSGAIDFIFASRPLMMKEPEFEILHLNSPFMVRLSDHDPIMARFKF
jgi:predicted extracellular nuclease